MNKYGTLVEAKNEYTKQFIDVLYPSIFTKIEKIYVNEFENLKDKNEVLVNFQRKLKQVPHWNNIQIDQATSEILETCEWFTDLFAAIFISNVKILTSIKPKSKKNQLNVTMPKCEDFVHKVYISVAENLYNNIDNFSYQSYGDQVFKKNKVRINELIKESIDQSIRLLIPYQNILQNYLNDALNMNESDSESEGSDDYEDAQDDEEPTGVEDNEPADNDEDETPDMNESNDVDPESVPNPDENTFDEPTMNNDLDETPCDVEEKTLDEPFEKPSFFKNDDETRHVAIQNPSGQQQSQPRQPMLFPDASDD